MKKVLGFLFGGLSAFFFVRKLIRWGGFFLFVTALVRIVGYDRLVQIATSLVSLLTNRHPS